MYLSGVPYVGRSVTVDLSSFLGALGELSLDDIRALAIDIDSMVTTVADEVEVTRAFLHIEAVLRHQRQLREATLAGHRATAIVQATARSFGVALPDDGVTRVADWSNTVARAIVAMHEHAHEAAHEAAHEMAYDLHVFTHGAEHIAVLAELTAA